VKLRRLAGVSKMTVASATMLRVGPPPRNGPRRNRRYQDLSSGIILPDEYQTNGEAECQAEKGRESPVPHDGLFKTFLTHTDTARDFLALHLPAELLQLCDLTTLQLESGSFIEENLRTYFADVRTP
jgi:hypothetical protein